MIESNASPFTGKNSYFGGKGASGVAQAIINQQPRHNIYIEPFAGAASIYFKKKAASCTALYEKDVRTYAVLQSKIEDIKGRLPTLSNSCGMDALRALHTVAKISPYDDRCSVLIYCDPPYLMESRKTSIKRYGTEWEESDHVELLNILKKLGKDGIHVQLSCYPNDLYAKHLIGWKHIDFTAMTRQGPVTERLYMNYDIEYYDLHDTSYIGKDYRERAQIKSSLQKLTSKYKSLSRRAKEAWLADIGLSDESLPF